MHETTVKIMHRIGKNCYKKPTTSEVDDRSEISARQNDSRRKKEITTHTHTRHSYVENLKKKMLKTT